MSDSLARGCTTRQIVIVGAEYQYRAWSPGCGAVLAAARGLGDQTIDAEILDVESGHLIVARRSRAQRCLIGADAGSVC